MNLEGLPLEERKKLTRSYPVLISAKPKAGKSAAVEFLPEEEKMRTAYFDIEEKNLPEDDYSQYRTIIRPKPTKIDKEDVYKYKDHDNVKYKTVTEILPHFKKCMVNDGIDRVVFDSFSAFVDLLETHYVTVSNGYTVWNKYNQELSQFYRDIKEEVYANGKFVYILGHYTPAKVKDGKKIDAESELYTKVKGNHHYRMVESNFNTVVSIEDFQFIADNKDAFSSTRIKRSLSPYQSNENSLAELEQALTGVKSEES